MSKGNGRGKRTGRPRVHAVWSLLAQLKGDQPVDPAVRRAVRTLQNAMARDLGADAMEDLSVQQQLIVARATMKGLVCDRIEALLLRTKGFIREDGTIIPILGANYLAYANSLRLDLALLGLERRAKDVPTSFGEYLARAYPGDGDGGDPLQEIPTGGEEGGP